MHLNGTDDSGGSTEKPILEDEPAVQANLKLPEQHITSQPPYLQPRLSLASVSVAANIPPYLLSAMLNRLVGLDFRDYVEDNSLPVFSKAYGPDTGSI